MKVALLFPLDWMCVGRTFFQFFFQKQSSYDIPRQRSPQRCPKSVSNVLHPRGRRRAFPEQKPRPQLPSNDRNHPQKGEKRPGRFRKPDRLRSAGFRSRSVGGGAGRQIQTSGNVFSKPGVLLPSMGVQPLSAVSWAPEVVAQEEFNDGHVHKS